MDQFGTYPAVVYEHNWQPGTAVGVEPVASRFARVSSLAKAVVALAVFSVVLSPVLAGWPLALCGVLLSRSAHSDIDNSSGMLVGKKQLEFARRCHVTAIVIHGALGAVLLIWFLWRMATHATVSTYGTDIN